MDLYIFLVTTTVTQSNQMKWQSKLDMEKPRVCKQPQNNPK